MVLSILAVSIRGLVRRIQLETLTFSRNRLNPAADSDISTLGGGVMDEHDRVVLQAPSQPALLLVPSQVVSVGVAAAEHSTRVERGFTTPARMVTSTSTATTTPEPTIMSRTASCEENFGNLEIGIAETGASVNSQVRARLLSAPQLKNKIQESSDEERYEGGMCASPESSDSSDCNNKVVSDGNRPDDVVTSNIDGSTSASRSSLGSSTLVSSPVDSVGSSEAGALGSSLVGALSVPLLPSTFMGVLSGGDSLLGADAGGTGRSGVTDEESAPEKDGELSKEPEIDGLRSRERDSSSIQAVVLEGVGSSSVSGAVPPGCSSPGLNIYVSGFAAAGVTSTSKSNDGQVSCSLPRPMVIDVLNNSNRLQFLLRTYIAARTNVFHADLPDAISSVQQLILQMTGLSLPDQRLIFNYRQSQENQTLESGNVVATMRSTALPRSWQLMITLVATIGRMCAVDDSQAPHGVNLVREQDIVRASVRKFLKLQYSVPMSEIIHVFRVVGATSALVMLLLSKVESNRQCAEESIIYFLRGLLDLNLPSHIRCHCALVLLDFCKLLSKSAPDHILYFECRLGFSCLLDVIYSSFFYKPKDIYCHDFPTVKEVPLLSSNKPDVPLLSSNDPSPGYPFGVAVKVGFEAGFRMLFFELLREIDDCLKKAVEEFDLERPGTEERQRPLFFVLLKGVHSIARIYDDTMDYLLDVLGRRSISFNILIRQYRWETDEFWLLVFKNFFDFDTKRKLVTDMLPDPEDDRRHHMTIDRSQLLTDSFYALAYQDPATLYKGLSVEFEDEEATGAGVLREWFCLVCKEVFRMPSLFLSCPKDLRRFFPNPSSGVNPGDLRYFRFCGQLISLALMHKVQVNVMLDVAFFKQLAGLPVSWEDIKDVDPVLYKSCQKILEMDAEMINSDGLGLSFVIDDIEEPGTRKTLELCPGGREILVNSENRKQYIDLLINRLFVRSVAKQVEAFSQGFCDLLIEGTHSDFLRAIDSGDLDLLLFGEDGDICLEDWKAYTEYQGYSLSDHQIRWFWVVMEEMTPEQRRRILFFSTSVTHLPAEGFVGLSTKFQIQRSTTDTSWLPTAHTCFNSFLLPPYTTLDMMRTRLHTITQDYTVAGFGFA